MKGSMWLFVIAMVLVMSVGVFAEIDKKQAGKDWLSMDKLLDGKDRFNFQNKFEKDPGGFVKSWQEYSKQFSKEYSSFAGKYGSERQVLNEVFDGVTKPLDAKRDHYQMINELTDFSVEGRTKAILGWADRAGRQNYSRWESMKEPAPEKYELKLKYARSALQFFQAADVLNPDGDYGEFIDQAKKAVKETEPLVKKALEGHVWPGHNKDYSGPGDMDEIAAAALEFLKKNPDWTKPEYDDTHEPYAACVTGNDWMVYKKAPLTHVPTQYSLDVLVAFTGKKDPDVAYVYHMVFYTTEEGGVKKGLPLRYANSRQYAKYKMLLDNVPKGSSGGGTSGGGFGLWRLILSVFLIAGGLIGGGAFFSAKIPQLKGIVSMLGGLTLPIGGVLLITGLGGFICNLIRLVPLASILPQITALALGVLFLRKSPMFQTSSGGTEDQAGEKKVAKAAEFLGKFAFLDSMESTLGFAGVILGLLHLIMGGFGFI